MAAAGGHGGYLQLILLANGSERWLAVAPLVVVAAPDLPRLRAVVKRWVRCLINVRLIYNYTPESFGSVEDGKDYVTKESRFLFFFVTLICHYYILRSFVSVERRKRL